jgi:heat shock protein HslJ
MTARLASIALTFALGVGIAGLAGCETAMSDDDATDQLTERDWVAKTIAGQAVIKPGRVTLAFAEGRVSGRGGCNHYSGAVEYGRGAIKIGPLISTKMACMEAGLMQQESTYLNTLQAAERYAVGADGRLTITTKLGAIVYDGAPRQVRPEE